jgi:hypothetical protein
MNNKASVVEAREWFTESQLFAMKENGFEQSAEMVRALLAATTEGPATHNAPTGAGDYDIVCEGCGEIVPDPHSWAECCAAQKAKAERLHGELATAIHLNDEFDVRVRAVMMVFDRMTHVDPSLSLVLRHAFELLHVDEEQ